MFQLILFSRMLHSCLILLISFCLNAQHSTEEFKILQKPRLQYATIFQKGAIIQHYWVSEKLDGVRGYWTGKKLLTRSGNDLLPPSWFVKDWPTVPMDGELWSERGSFEQISACVRRKRSNKECWKNLKLMIFDLPHQAGAFTMRISNMELLTQKNDSPYLAMIEQIKLSNDKQLYALLDDVIDKNGEGLMLHLSSSHYKSGRSKHLLKLKKHQDAEAIVLAHTPGKGKLKGLLGALLVETPEGISFKIGSGFSDFERQHPPKVGSTITYKYIGKTQRGVPRFASFLRIKNEH